MRWLFNPQLRPFVLLAGGASLLLNLAMLVPALYATQVFDRVFSSRSLETLAMLSILVLLALGLGWCMDVARARALAHAGRVLDACLSPPLLHDVLARACGSQRTAEDGDALRDVSRLRAFLGSGGVLAVFDAPWLPIYLLAIGMMHPLLGLAAAAGAVLLFALGVLTERLTRAATLAAQDRGRDAARYSQALLRNAEVIAGMGMAGAGVAAWKCRHDALLQGQSELGTVTARLSATARIARQLLQAGMLALGAWLVVGAEASPGIMVAATILLGRALQPIEQLISGWKALIEARGAWSRLAAREAAAASQTLSLPAPQGRLQVERLVYGGTAQRAAVLRGASLSLEPGESLGLVGASGAGKTTLLRLVLGIWQPQSGTVRLDGADIARWKRDELGRHVGYLPQDVELFAGTVAENIARLGAVDAEAVVAAARLAHAHEMILRLPQGYDTPVGEAGRVLSGGQRQRVGLARALYGSPRLVVLDEPNAHLDAEGDAALVAALSELKQAGTTVLMVNHRPALMARLDKVAVLKDGVLEVYRQAAADAPRLQAVPAPATPVENPAAPARPSAAVAV